MDDHSGEEIKHDFLLFGYMSVKYDGRASSVLADGNYLIIHKRDGSTAVHGGQLITPLNYQPAGSKLYADGWRLICRSKKERMELDVHQVHHIYLPSDWSTNRIRLVRTEKQLRDRLADDLHRYVPDLVQTHKEMPTPHGPVDLVGIDRAGVYHVVEVKRTRVSVSTAVQLRKYLDALEATGVRTVGYVAAPAILENARSYCDKRGYRFLQIQHSEPD